MTQRLYAFWSYDQFPHFLGSEVEEILPGGKVRVTDYGRGIFRYAKITPYDEGVAIHKELKNLELRYKAKIEGITEDFEKQVAKLFNRE